LDNVTQLLDVLIQRIEVSGEKKREGGRLAGNEPGGLMAMAQLRDAARRVQKKKA
jgi:hypothetical protein